MRITVNRIKQIDRIAAFLTEYFHFVEEGTLYLHPWVYHELNIGHDPRYPINLVGTNYGFVNVAKSSYNDNVWEYYPTDKSPIYSGEVYKKLDKAKNVGDNK